MRKLLWLLLSFFTLQTANAQTYFYIEQQEYDANGIPLLEKPRQNGSYFTFKGNYMYRSNSNGVKSGCMWIFDGNTDNNGYKHYIPYNEDESLNSGWLSPSQVAYLKEQRKIIDRNSFGEWLVSPDHSIMYEFYGIGVPRGGCCEYKKGVPPSNNQNMPRIPTSSTSSQSSVSQQNVLYNPQLSPSTNTQPSSNYMECAVCNGTGKCRTCAGRGEYRNSQTNTLYDCGVCRGGGKCHVCYGRGKVRK